MPTDAKVDVVLQRIEENIGDEIEVIPSHIRRYGVNNIFQRVLGYLFGWDIHGKPHKLRCTLAGVLKTAPSGAGLEAYERNPTSAVDGYITLVAAALKAEAFTQVMSSVDIFTEDNDIKVGFSPDGVTWGSWIYVRGSINQSYSVDIACKAVRFQNVDVTGANDGKFQVIGWR